MKMFPSWMYFDVVVYEKALFRDVLFDVLVYGKTFFPWIYFNEVIY